MEPKLSEAQLEAGRWLAALPTDPDVHLYDFDLARKAAVLVRIDERTYREASFLDQRALGPDTPMLVLPVDPAVEVLASAPPRTLHAIFHVGHCGSTLVSRLLGALPGNLPKREPLSWLTCGMLTRTIGTPQAALTERALHALWDANLRALARTYAPDQVAIVKSTSAAASMLPAFLQGDPARRALLLRVSLEAFLATMLRAPATRQSAEHYAPSWIADLAFHGERQDLRPDRMTAAERVASCWLGAMHWFGRAQRERAEQVRLVDFDRFLEHPQVGLAALAAFFGLPTGSADIDAALAGQLARDAKAPGRAYDGAARKDELARARAAHAAEIAEGLRFAEQFAANEPLVGANLR